MTNKHTPGPWTVATVHPNEDVPCVFQEKDTSQIICKVLKADTQKQTFADADLIAAAPEMKEALIGIHELWGGYDGYLKEVEACEELGIESPVLKAWKQLLSAIKKSGGM